jgi:4a-hydroxytetrahydrobiopterin dehydratase
MKLPPDQVTEQLKSMPGWALDGDSIVRTYTFATFTDSIAFVTRLAFEAEAADHHPDLKVSYRKVTVTWATHSAGGLTEKDFAGARQSDMIAGRFL